MNEEATQALTQAIRLNAARHHADTLLRRMGYGQVNSTRRARLARVLDDDLLGLDNGEFDLRFDTVGFARALCDALDLPVDMVEAGLSDLHQQVARRRASAPSMFVETGFKRKREPVFVLSAMETKRWIVFERSFRHLPPTQQVWIAGEYVREHYQVHAGVLPLWGAIQRYVLFHAPEGRLLLDIDGQLIDDNPKLEMSRARLRINGRVIKSDQILD